MKTAQEKEIKQQYGGLDAFRIVAAILVIAIHTSPLTSLSEDADFFLTRVLARIAVPFFFMVTGQFILSDIFDSQRNLTGKRKRYLTKTAILYGCSILLYLPLGIYAGHYSSVTIFTVFKMLLFDGTFYHLWYFPACIIGVCIVALLGRCGNKKIIIIISGALYLVGLLGDSYYGLISRIPAIETLYQYGFGIWSYTRNGLFFAPLFLVLGAILGQRTKEIQGSKKHTKTGQALGFCIAFLIMTAEAFIVRNAGWQRHDAMYIMLPAVMVFLYRFLLLQEKPSKRFLRTISTWIYVLHPAVIAFVHGLAGAASMTVFTENSIVNYVAVTALSAAAAGVIAFFIKGRERKCSEKGRAWIELDEGALRNNVQFLRNRLPENCKLMPAIKANAYGHGAVLMAEKLSEMGINSFCVACIQEGIELRKSGFRGELLILGYTSPSQFDLLRKYHLTQTVVDYSYAKLMQEYGKKLHVHIGIDTGMHRLGERSENIEEIKKIFAMKNLIIDGMYTHLSADDTSNKSDQEFTYHQAEEFYRVVEELKSSGIPCPKLHLQASYGVLNYPELSGDYARIGIVLYGILSTKADTEPWKKELKPVLSLKARIASVRMIQAGESAGYGNPFIAEKPMKIATLAIGYADGLPRALSNGNGAVLIHGKKAPILGRICMDQTLVDVSGIKDVQAGDVAVLIGESENCEISACDIAEQTGTITNEVLSRLGKRLEHIFTV